MPGPPPSDPVEPDDAASPSRATDAAATTPDDPATEPATEHALRDAAAALRVRRRRRSRQWRRRTVRRRVLLSVAVIGGLAVVSLLQVLIATSSLRTTAARVVDAQTALLGGDVETARTAADGAHDAARRSRLAVSGPHLWLAERIPLLGRDVRAVRTVAASAVTLTGPVVDELFDIRTTLDPEAIRPIDGQVDLTLFASAAAQMDLTRQQVTDAADRVERLEGASLLPPVGRGLARIEAEIAEIRELSDLFAGVLEMMPRLLGAEESRRYLVVFQNNAEFRATGGIPGAFAVLEADGGRLTMNEQGAVPALGGRRTTSVVPLSDEEQALFDGKLGRFVQNVNLTPDWSRSGEILAAMWRQVTGTEIDGVISVDPVVLSYVLRGTGPVELPDDKVATDENAVQLLLNQAYFDYQTSLEQDDFFEESARRIFDNLVQGNGDAATALSGLFEGVREGRGLAWLRAADEQSRIAGSLVAGELGRGEGRRPEIGVYLNDSTSTKLDYYVNTRTEVLRHRCLAGGRQLLQVETTILSLVPEGVRFPVLLQGTPVPQARPGSLLLTVLGYGPHGGTISEPLIDGEPGAPAAFTHEGRPVVARTVLLEPGQAVRLSWTTETGPDQDGAPRLRTTPSALNPGTGYVESQGC